MTRTPRRRLAGIAALGLLATATIVVGGALAGAAAPASGAKLWAVPAVPVRPSIDVVPALALFYGGMILLVRVWLGLRRHVLVQGASVAAVALITIVWSLPLLAGPPLGSRDVYAYAAQGELADEGFDVYEEGPAALGDSAVLEPVDPLYLDAPVLYGPLFVALSSAVSSNTDGVVGSVLAFRALAVAGLVIAAIAVCDLARSFGRDPADALVLAVANPLALLHLVSGAHNEAIMLAFLLTGVAIGRRAHLRLGVGSRHFEPSRELALFAGITLCAVAAAIKVPAILGAAFLAWPWVRAATDWRHQAARLAFGGGFALVVIALAGQLTGWGWGWVDAMVGADPVDAYLSVTSVLGGAVHLLTGMEAAVVLSVARIAGLAVAALTTAWLLFRGRQSAPAALGWSLLLLALLHPTTQPWYLLWGLMFMAATSAGERNRAFVAVSAFACFVVLPAGPQLALTLLEDNRTATMVVALAVLATLTFSPVPRRRFYSPIPRRLGLVSVVVPTRNEAANVKPLVDRVLASTTGPVEILFVDDSDDHTPAEIDRVAAKVAEVRGRHAVRCLHRQPDERWGGLSGAVVDGFEHAIGSVAVVIDGDLQHPPEKIGELVAATRAGSDVAIGSRRIPGGEEELGLTASRRRTSKAVTAVARWAFPHRIGPVNDPLSGFFAVRLDRIDLGLLQPDGFKILVEILGTHGDLRATEVPFAFADRTDGDSKASVAQGLRFFGHLIDLRLRTTRPWAGAVNPQRLFRSA